MIRVRFTDSPQNATDAMADATGFSLRKSEVNPLGLELRLAGELYAAYDPYEGWTLGDPKIAYREITVEETT